MPFPVLLVNIALYLLSPTPELTASDPNSYWTSIKEDSQAFFAVVLFGSISASSFHCTFLHSLLVFFLSVWQVQPACAIGSSDFDFFLEIHMLHMCLVWPWNPQNSLYKKSVFENIVSFLFGLLSSRKLALYKSWKNFYEIVRKEYQKKCYFVLISKRRRKGELLQKGTLFYRKTDFVKI